MGAAAGGVAHARPQDSVEVPSAAGSPAAATEDLELVAEHGSLEIQLVEAAADEQAE